MEAKYKIGQKVKCKIHRTEFVIKRICGDLYYADEYSDVVCCNYKHDHNEKHGISSNDLELVEENKPNFKIGDYVKIIKLNHVSLDINKIYEIVHSHNDGPVVIGTDGRYYYIYSSEYKIIHRELYLKEDNYMFSICDYVDEILTGLKDVKIVEKRKVEQQLKSNQNEINHRISSEFWEDGTLPNKLRVLEINAEIESEKKDKK